MHIVCAYILGVAVGIDAKCISLVCHLHCQLKACHMFTVCITYMCCGTWHHYCSFLLSLETQLCSGMCMAAGHLPGKTLATLIQTLVQHIHVYNECWGLPSLLYTYIHAYKVVGMLTSSLNRAQTRTVWSMCTRESKVLFVTLYIHISVQGRGGRAMQKRPRIKANSYMYFLS